MACCLPCLGIFGLYHTAKSGLKQELGVNEKPLDAKWDPPQRRGIQQGRVSPPLAHLKGWFTTCQA